MSYAHLFVADNVILDLESDDKNGILSEMVERLVSTGSLPDARREEVVAALRKREDAGSTGIGCGVAIPHVKLANHEGVLTAIGLHRGGVDYQAVDGEKVHILIMILRPDEQHEDHLQFLKWVSRLGRDADFRSFILQAKSGPVVVDLMDEMSGL